jgi:dTDP-4-amino-4,6-dideoxygalactose transaminase
MERQSGEQVMTKLAINGGKPLRKTSFPKWPCIDKHDEDIVGDVVRSGKWWMYSYGSDEFAETVKGTSKVENSEKLFADMHHVKYAYATTSGSASLEIACRAIDLQPGDEVITTPYTFIATSTCILNAMAIPVYVDIEPDTYNINPNLIEDAITERTKAIIPVHFGGNIANMDAINAIAKKHGLKVIEDAAHAHGASLKDGRWAGTLGDIAIFSLQQSKLLTCGEGGFITTNDDDLAEKSWSLRHYGRTKTGKWYEHFRLGWHYRMSELQGGLLVSQIEKLAAQNQIRSRNVKLLRKEFESIEGVEPVRQNPDIDNDVYYVLCLRYDQDKWGGISRDTVADALIAEGIPVFAGYSFPLYANPLFQNIDFNSAGSPYMTGRTAPIADFSQYGTKCPVTERACHKESIWLTHDMLMGTEEDTMDIIRGFMKVYENRESLRIMENKK